MADDAINAERPLDEQLVAYLDGELDSETSRRIEEALANDARLRDTLQRLDRTWELLGTLDRPPVDDRFTQSTLEMVTVAAAEDVERTQAMIPRRRRRRLVLAGGSVVAAGLAGFLAVALLSADPNRPLVEDLPVLLNLDEYRQVDSVEFLQVLNREGLFSEEIEDE